MAVDTFKEAAENPLRQAMRNAGDIVRGGRAPTNARAEEIPLDTAELVEVTDRKLMRRVDIKVAMVSYIDSIFRNRTAQDGTVVGVSREQLLQELTEIVVELDERASQGNVAGVAKPKATHGHGDPTRA